MKQYYQLFNINIIEAYAENVDLKGSQFDVVFCRQAMHHANNLNNFVKNTTSYLKTGGIFFSLRDHVIYNKKDKLLFLQSHPLHKYYGGENAFTSKEYRNAITKAGLKIIKEIQHFDSIINYYPISHEEYEERLVSWENLIYSTSKKIPFSFINFILPII